MRYVINNGTIFDGESCHKNASLIITDELVEALLPNDNGAETNGLPRLDLEGRILLPGFIDLQVNGGGDLLFNDNPCLATIEIMAQAHRQYGTTGFLPTLISTDFATMRAAMAAVDEAIKKGVPGVLGIHLEGPFLSPAYAGIHPADQFHVLDDVSITLLSSLKQGFTLVTLAPECTSLERIRQLKAAGISVAAGHSAATYDQVQDALAAGLDGFTHIYNAMSPFLSRAPGMVGAALEDRESWVGIIADGIHVHPATVAITVAAKTKGKVILVTDAMSCVGGAENEGGKQFEFNGQTIRVNNGRCENADGTLAGSDLNMLAAVKNAMAFAKLDIYEACRMASRYPAAALGAQSQLGSIHAGAKASFVELDAAFDIKRSFVDGLSYDQQGKLEVFAWK